MGKDECYLINPFVSYKHTISKYIYIYNIIFPFRFPYWVFNFSICGCSKADCCILLYWLLPSPKYHISKKQTQNVQVSRYFYVIRCPSLWFFLCKGWSLGMGVHTIHTSCNLGMNIHINQPNREVHLQGHMEFPCILHLPRSGTACHHVLHQTTPAKFDKEPTKSTKCIKLYQDTISTHNQQTGQLPDPISGAP